MLLSITFTFVLLPSLANCLVCKLGFVVKQTPYPDKLPIGNQTTIEKCPGSHDKSGEACVAVETTAMIGGILFAGTGFECVHSQKCPNIYKECAHIARAAMGGLLDSSPIKTCKIDCCYTDHCNSAPLKHWMTDPVSSQSQLTTPSGSVSQEGGSTTADMKALKIKMEQMLAEITLKQAQVVTTQAETNAKLASMEEIQKRTLRVQNETKTAQAETQKLLTEIKSTFMKTKELQADNVAKQRNMTLLQRETAKLLVEVRSTQAGTSLHMERLVRLYNTTVTAQTGTRRLLSQVMSEQRLSKSMQLDATQHLADVASTQVDIRTLQEQTVGKLAEVMAVQMRTETTQEETVVKLINVTVLQAHVQRTQKDIKKTQDLTKTIVDDVKSTHNWTIAALSKIHTSQEKLAEQLRKITSIQQATNTSLTKTISTQGALRDLQAQAAASLRNITSAHVKNVELLAKMQGVQSQADMSLKNISKLHQAATIVLANTQTRLSTVSGVQAESSARLQELEEMYNVTKTLQHMTVERLKNTSHIHQENKKMQAEMKSVHAKLELKAIDLVALCNNSETLHAEVRLIQEHTVEMLVNISTLHNETGAMLAKSKHALVAVKENQETAISKIAKIQSVQSEMEKMQNSTKVQLQKMTKLQHESANLLLEAKEVQQKSILLLRNETKSYTNIVLMQYKTNETLGAVFVAQNNTEKKLRQAAQTFSDAQNMHHMMRKMLDNITNFQEHTAETQAVLELKQQKADLRWNSIMTICNKTENAQAKMLVLVQKGKLEVAKMKSIRMQADTKQNETISKFRETVSEQINQKAARSHVDEAIAEVWSELERMMNVFNSSAFTQEATEEKLQQITMQQNEAARFQQHLFNNQTKLLRMQADNNATLQETKLILAASNNDTLATRVKTEMMLTSLTELRENTLKKVATIMEKLAEFEFIVDKSQNISQVQALSAKFVNETLVAGFALFFDEAMTLRNQTTIAHDEIVLKLSQIKQDQEDTRKRFSDVTKTLVATKAMQEDAIRKLAKMKSLHSKAVDLQALTSSTLDRMGKEHAACVALQKQSSRQSAALHATQSLVIAKTPGEFSRENKVANFTADKSAKSLHATKVSTPAVHLPMPTVPDASPDKKYRADNKRKDHGFRSDQGHPEDNSTANVQTKSEKEHKDSKLVNIVSKSVSRVSTSPASEKTDLSHSATKSSPSHQSLELSSETSSPEERTLTNGPKDNLTYSQTIVSPTAARVNHTSQNALLSALGHERAATMRNSSSITRSARLLLLLFLLYWSYKYVL